MWKGIAELIEKLPSLLKNIAIPLIVIGLSFEIAFFFKFLDRSIIGGYASEYSSAALVLGIGILITRFIFELSQIPKYISDKRKLRNYSFQLLDAIRFLNPEEKLMLFWIVHHNKGRIYIQNSNILDKLHRLNFITYERLPLGVGPTSGPSMYCIHPELRKRNKTLLIILKNDLHSEFKCLDNEAQIRKLLSPHLTEPRARERC